MESCDFTILTYICECRLASVARRTRQGESPFPDASFARSPSSVMWDAAYLGRTGGRDLESPVLEMPLDLKPCLL